VAVQLEGLSSCGITPERPLHQLHQKGAEADSGQGAPPCATARWQPRPLGATARWQPRPLGAPASNFFFSSSASSFLMPTFTTVGEPSTCSQRSSTE
jgi:hypothetical protein